MLQGVKEEARGGTVSVGSLGWCMWWIGAPRTPDRTCHQSCHARRSASAFAVAAATVQ
jgi:hypothetical protein